MTTRPMLTTVTEHLTGAPKSWHGRTTPDGPHQPDADRYHLYIGLFCPSPSPPCLLLPPLGNSYSSLHPSAYPF